MKGPIRWLVAIGAGVILSITGISFAHATEVTPSASPSAPPNCKTVVSDMAARPDSGAAPGVTHWADDKIHRVVTVCHIEDEQPTAKFAPVKYWTYATVGDDTGTFTTVGTKSPQHGWPMKTGVKGTLTGHFSLQFTAPANWAGFSDSTVHNSSAFSTSEWLAKLWSADGYEANEKSFYWKWTYKLCEQFWVNSVNGNSGDITGYRLKHCPSPSPSVSPSAVGGTTPTTAPTTPAPAGLPVTGPSNIQWVGMTGGAMFIGGAGLLLFLRRRRNMIRFTA